MLKLTVVACPGLRVVFEKAASCREGGAMFRTSSLIQIIDVFAPETVPVFETEKVTLMVWSR